MAATLLPLDQLDPAQAWQPWQPSTSDAWGRKWAAHLYRRAAFGASRADLLEAERLGPEASLDLLFRGQPQAEELLQTLHDVGRTAAAHDDNGDQLRDWWLYCMLQSGHPLREKMVLFWHNHFATSISKVQNPVLMFRQNCLLRAHALGRFDALLHAISRDAAMLLWLDSDRNVKGKPNENYARELMELFSLGIGHYSEQDVREAARAFTGWHTNGEDFAFNPRLHDDGTKTILGQTGTWDGGEVVRIVLEQPAAAEFLVRKLYAFLISEQTTPPAALLEPLCASFRKSKYDIAALVRMMLSSRHFYSEYAFRKRIKSPVEYVLGAVQAVYRRYGEKEPEYRPLPQKMLVSPVGTMGQQLFAPPNVKGWPGGRSWLNASTMVERNNFAGALALGMLWTNGDGSRETAPPPAFDAARLLLEEGPERPEDVVRVLLDLYLPGGVRTEARAKLVAFVAVGKPTGVALDHRVRETVHAILAMPESQLA